MSSVKFDDYELIDGTRRTLVKQVADGSIIKRFEMTPIPRLAADIVCPHFLEFKWALGCPFDCAWCYLKGSLRYYSRKYSRKNMLTRKSPDRIKEHLMQLFRAPSNVREVLNAGEVADSLADENSSEPFTRLVIPLFEKQDRYKLMLLTKSSKVDNLLEISPHNQVIVSFSLNSDPVAKKWEIAPAVADRLKAAKRVLEAGYVVRIRIDPIVPYPDDWKVHYRTLVDSIFTNVYPDRITIGSLRGLQSTINEATDKSWVEYLKEPSRWGRRISSGLRRETFQVVKDYIEDEYSYGKIALCKEPVEMWQSLNMNWKDCRCNCTW